MVVILKVKDGSFGYSKEKLLYNNVEFSIKKGEILSILGTNGSGKTTMLKCMLGLLKWNTGKTYIDDIDFDKIPSKDVWKRIAYVPQTRGKTLPINVTEMIELGRSPYLNMYSQPKKEDKKIVIEIMDMLNIAYLKDKNCNRISGGELQMVLIARALAASPELIILDEPESNLDFRNQLIILNTLEMLVKDKGISCIINTHYPNHALKISNKTIMIDKGKKATIIGNTKDIITEENLRKIFKVNVSIDNIDIMGTKYDTITPISIINH